MATNTLINMKIRILLFVVALLSIYAISGCQKANIAPVADKTIDQTKLATQAIAVIDTTDVTITLPQDSLQLTGKSGKPGDVIVGYLWSQISGPNEAVIVNESSQSAKAKKLIAGKYLFQFMVIDKAGYTGIDTLTVTVKSANLSTLTLSPTNNPYETNVGILGNQDASNHTSVEEPLCAWTINGVPVTVRNLLKFDLSSIPANATIVSAHLYMQSDTIPLNGDLIHANYGNDNSFIVQQVATSWDPSTVTWFNQPVAFTANQVTVPTTALPFLNVDINVKDMVSSMVSTNANYGFKLSLVNENLYTSRIFCSSYYADASRHPKLVVVYQ